MSEFAKCAVCGGNTFFTRVLLRVKPAHAKTNAPLMTRIKGEIPDLRRTKEVDPNETWYAVHDTRTVLICHKCGKELIAGGDVNEDRTGS